MKEVIVGPTSAGVPLSGCIRAGDFVYISGQVPDDANASVAVQTRQVMQKVAALLEQAGAAMSDVVKTTVFLADTRHFQEMNQAYAEFFTGAPPCRSTIEARLMRAGLLVEVEVVAYKPKA